MDIIERPIGTEGNIKVVLEGGKIKFLAVMDTKGVDANLSASVDSDYFIDQIALAIPGTIDDAIFGVLKAALKAVA